MVSEFGKSVTAKHSYWLGLNRDMFTLHSVSHAKVKPPEDMHTSANPRFTGKQSMSLTDDYGEAQIHYELLQLLLAASHLHTKQSISQNHVDSTDAAQMVY